MTDNLTPQLIWLLEECNEKPYTLLPGRGALLQQLRDNGLILPLGSGANQNTTTPLTRLGAKALRNPANNYLTPVQVAGQAGVTIGYIHRLCREGEIPAIRHGRQWFIKQEDADKFSQSERGLVGAASPKHPWHDNPPIREPDPNSLASRGLGAKLWLPCSQEEAGHIAEALGPDERLQILQKAMAAKGSNGS